MSRSRRARRTVEAKNRLLLENSKLVSLEAVIEEFRREKLTGTLELFFKQGEYRGGRKQISL